MLSTAAAAPPVVVDSASTADSKSITVSYDVTTPISASNPLVFGVYRSADATFDGSDEQVGPGTLAAPRLDDAGGNASAVGHHSATIAVPGGLPSNPEHPYVLVVADPATAQATGSAAMVGAFRKYTIGVITHGGIQNQNWKNGPPWELAMARSLRREGYDFVIPFNWVSASGDAGSAVRQVPRLARTVLAAAESAPAGEPVDIQFIGHSEGASINAEAIKAVVAAREPAIEAGWLHETMLDPHAANNGAPGQQYSTSRSILGVIADGVIGHYQSEAKDPLVTVPAGVDQSEVFYQHNTAFHDRGTNDGIYNLWGQVPVKGASTYFDLTNVGTTHSGKSGVQMWYQSRVVPLLGDGAPQLQAHALSGSSVGTVADAGSGIATAWTHRVTFSGHATPGSTVRLLAGPARDAGAIGHVGMAVADSAGAWTIVSRPLRDGAYRLIATDVQRPIRGKGQLNFKPEATLGRLVVDAS